MTKCIFYKFNRCQLLTVNRCDPNGCSFFKTEAQFEKSRNEAIALNRQKGNCDKCKYMNIRCKLPGDVEEENY